MKEFEKKHPLQLAVVTFTIVEVTQLQLHPPISPLAREPWITKECTTRPAGNTTTPHLPWMQMLEVVAIQENVARRHASSEADSDRRLLAWTKTAAPVIYPQHNVSSICCVLGQHATVDLAMYFQPTATPALGRIREYPVHKSTELKILLSQNISHARIWIFKLCYLWRTINLIIWKFILQKWLHWFILINTF